MKLLISHDPQCKTNQTYLENCPCVSTRPSNLMGNLTSQLPTMFWILKSINFAWKNKRTKIALTLTLNQGRGEGVKKLRKKERVGKKAWHSTPFWGRGWNLELTMWQTRVSGRTPWSLLWLVSLSLVIGRLRLVPWAALCNLSAQ